MDDAKNPRSKESKLKMAKHVVNYKVKDFVADDEKAAEIEQQVNKEQNKKDQDKEEKEIEESSLAPDDQEAIEQLEDNITKLKESMDAEKKDGNLKVEEFEKDVDENFHVDFIHAMANIRAANYGL